MASLPPRSAAQRSQASQSGQAAAPHSSATPRELNLEDSQTIIIDANSSQHTEQTSSANATQKDGSHSTAYGDGEELPKCWICFQDPSEDDPLVASPWRHPCPCALTAHEACLLDWVADMESPTNARRAGRQGKILCPQCKSEIKLSRPRSFVVDAYRRIDSLATWAVIPGIAAAGSASLGLVSQWHGIFTIYQIFGPQDAYELLRPLSDGLLLPTWSEALPSLLRNWRLLIGPTLIPPILILSRTSVADGILPILPMIFFATKPDKLITGSGKGAWPPSAALSFALLPYIRGAYNAYYERVWTQREQEWLRQIKPRSATDSQEADGNEAERDVNEIAGVRIEDEMGNFDIDLRIVEGEWDANGPVAIQPQAAPVAHPLNAPPLDNGADGAAPAPNVPDNRAQQPEEPAAAQPVQRRERNATIGAFGLARTVFGALFFPSVAASVGELLRIALPASWVNLPVVRSRWGITTRAPTGLLQTRWGRSLVGGCLFVFMRDAVRLYVRWKMANMHRKRTVLDYDGPRPGSSR